MPTSCSVFGGFSIEMNKMIKFLQVEVKIINIVYHPDVDSNPKKQTFGLKFKRSDLS